VGFDQILPMGVGVPGFIYWIAAAIVFAPFLVFTALAFAREARPMPPGGRRLQTTVLAVGALGVFVLGCYLLLIGWPGIGLDTLW
jgi:hypothetical protein